MHKFLPWSFEHVPAAQHDESVPPNAASQMVKLCRAAVDYARYAHCVFSCSSFNFNTVLQARQQELLNQIDFMVQSKVQADFSAAQ